MNPRNNFENLYSKFIIKNEDLVDQYENQFQERLSDISYDVKIIYESINNISKVSPTQLLNNAIRRSISSNMSLIEVLDNIKGEVSVNGNEYNSIQKYFNEINNIYNKNNNNYDIEYCPENRDKLIEMNLKSVISIAKKYQNLGLPLEDLISAGNVGLVIAFDRYNPKRAKLKDNIIAEIEKLEDIITYKQLMETVKDYLTYGDVKQSFINKFHDGKEYTKKEVIKWVNRNIQNAKFNSVANMWIEAYIIQEINDNSRLVKKPKSEIQKDKEKDGFYRKESVISMTSPVNSDSDTPVGEVLRIEDDEASDLDVKEAYNVFKGVLNQLLEGVKGRDRSILLKKFGIGLPRPMEPKEIAEQEGLSIARVSQIFQSVLAQMQENQKKYDIDPEITYEAVSKII